MNLQNKSNKNFQNFQNIGIIMYEVCSQKKLVNMERLQILEND